MPHKIQYNAKQLQLFQVQYEGQQQGDQLRMNQQDINKLYLVDTEQVSTKSRITFTPPMNVVNEPIFRLGKSETDYVLYKCIDFKGSYQSEQNYLNEICNYMIDAWNTYYGTTNIIFKFDTYYLMKSLRARFICNQVDIVKNPDGTEIKTETPVQFYFSTINYKLQKVLGIKDLNIDGKQQYISFISSLTKVKYLLDNGRYATKEQQAVTFPRKMFINGIRYLNIICYGIHEFTHRENNEERYILLRQYYNVQNGVYCELSSDYYVTFQVNQLAGNGIRIYFCDEEYVQLDLENEPYTLELFIEPSQAMIERRAIIEQNQNERLEKEQMERQIQEQKRLEKEEMLRQKMEAEEEQRLQDEMEAERIEQERIEEERQQFILQEKMKEEALRIKYLKEQEEIAIMIKAEEEKKKAQEKKLFIQEQFEILRNTMLLQTQQRETLEQQRFEQRNAQEIQLFQQRVENENKIILQMNEMQKNVLEEIQQKHIQELIVMNEKMKEKEELRFLRQQKLKIFEEIQKREHYTELTETNMKIKESLQRPFEIMQYLGEEEQQEVMKHYAILSQTYENGTKQIEKLIEDKHEFNRKVQIELEKIEEEEICNQDMTDKEKIDMMWQFVKTYQQENKKYIELRDKHLDSLRSFRDLVFQTHNELENHYSNRLKEYKQQEMLKLQTEQYDQRLLQ